MLEAKATTIDKEHRNENNSRSSLLNCGDKCTSMESLSEH